MASICRPLLGCLCASLLCLLCQAANAADWQFWSTTAMGGGADCTVEPDQPNLGAKPDVGVRFNQYPTHTQKTFLRFDLRKPERAAGVKPSGNPLVPNLVLTLAAKADADHRINVFGLIDRRSYGGTKAKPILGADWAEDQLTYANAPAASPYGGGEYTDGKEKWEKGMLGGVAHEPTVLLGTITVKEGQEGEVVTPLPNLDAFIAKNAKSKVVTLILCRVTQTLNVTAFVSKDGDPVKAPKLAY